VALAAVAAHADVQVSPVASVSPVVLTVHVAVDGVPFEAKPLYYPSDTSEPIAGIGVHGTGGTRNIVLAEINGTVRNTVSSAGDPLAVLLYGEVVPDSDWTPDIPVLYVSDGDALKAALDGDAVITVTYGRTAYLLDGVNDIAAIVVRGQTFGIAAGDEAIQIMDITDPEHMMAIESLPYKGRDVEVVPDTTYALVTHPDGVYVLDMSWPYQPYIVYAMADDSGGYERLDGASDIETVTLSGSTFAVITAFDDDGIQIVDVTDPTKPVPVSSVADNLEGYDALDGARGVDLVAISGRTYGVVTSYNEDAIQIIDLVNPYLPQPVSSFDGGSDATVRLDGATDVEVLIDEEEAYALVTSYNDDAIQIVNITTPAVPTKIRSIVDNEGRFNALGGATDIDVFTVARTTYGLVSAYDDDAIQILDLNNPSLPRAVGDTLEDDDHEFHLDGVRGMETITVQDSTYLLAAAHVDDRIQVISLDRPASPVPVSHVSHPANVVASLEGSWGMDIITLDGRTYGIVASYPDNAIQVVNVTDPRMPLPVSNVFDEDGQIEALGGATDVEAISIGGHTYGVVAAYDDDAIQIINLTNFADPQFVQEILDGENGFEALGGPLNVETAVISGRVYGLVAAYDDDAVQIIDLTDPRFPLPTSDIHRGDVFVADEDIGEEDPVRINILDGPRGLAVVDIRDRTYCLVASQNDDSLLILDVTSPADPWPVTIMYDNLRGVEALNGATDIEVLKTGGRVYAMITGKWEDGMQILDITNPADPMPVTAVFDNRDGYVALRGATDIEVAPVADRTIAIVSGAFDDAVQFIDVTDPTNPAPLHAVFDGSGGYAALDGADDVEIFRTSTGTHLMVTSIMDGAIQIMRLDP
jgi:hypothetical protein